MWQINVRQAFRVNVVVRFIVGTLLLTSIVQGAEQSKPTIIVDTFVLPAGVSWPYDMNQLKFETLAELIKKDDRYFYVVPEPLKDAKGVVYTLRGEVLEWHSGNRAKRLLVGMGSGRETAKIHYWLTDASGKRIFDHTDTIRQAFLGNTYAKSVGQLAQPFADKIAERLREAKLTESGSTANGAAQSDWQRTD
ncbi:MAG TPA: DUF4410 domain-containing protein [Terriglobales bacterium]|nr:DUF4410 domain-containing protein [Terriglobales bacterium]